MGKNIVGYGPRPPEEGEFAAHPSGVKGRGTLSNVSGRFEREHRVVTDDGWGTLDEGPPPLKTMVGIDATRTIIARNTSPDIPFDRSINPYRGCEHGCIYCFARPTHAYLGLSPGQDFESRLFAKPKAAQLLAAELRKPGYSVKVMALGTNTDPYQPIDERYKSAAGDCRPACWLANSAGRAVARGHGECPPR